MDELASLLEERLADDPEATHVVVHALNQWMHEHWTFEFEDRIFPTPVITLAPMIVSTQNISTTATMATPMLVPTRDTSRPGPKP